MHHRQLHLTLCHELLSQNTHSPKHTLSLLWKLHFLLEYHRGRCKAVDGALKKTLNEVWRYVALEFIDYSRYSESDV